MTGSDQHARRTCPGCEKDRLYSPREFRRVLDVRAMPDAIDSHLTHADLACGYCWAFRSSGSGTWGRMVPVEARAEALARSSGTKDAADYWRILTRGRRADA
jgi:hypothetical protein